MGMAELLNGQLLRMDDNGRLEKVKNSPEMGKAFMDAIDTDLSGSVNEDEWLTFFAKLYNKHPESAAEVLRLYEEALRKPTGSEKMTISKQEGNSSVAEIVVEETAIGQDGCVFTPQWLQTRYMLGLWGFSCR